MSVLHKGLTGTPWHDYGTPLFIDTHTMVPPFYRLYQGGYHELGYPLAIVYVKEGTIPYRDTINPKVTNT